MNHKHKVTIQMESVWEEERTLQLAEGILFERPDSWFLRFEEPESEYGVVTTTVKCTQHQIKLMRRGGVESDMIFEVGVTHQGFYTTPLIHLELETITTEILVEIQEGKGRLIWAYMLNAQDDLSSLRRVTVWLS